MNEGRCKHIVAQAYAAEPEELQRAAAWWAVQGRPLTDAERIQFYRCVDCGSTHSVRGKREKLT